MTVISCDFETRSQADLKKVGLYRYAEDPSTDVWCMSYAIDGAEPEIWRMGEPFPKVLAFFASRPEAEEWRAWNSQFERVIWRDVMTRRHGWPALPLEAWFDTMADAGAMSLPRALGECAAVLGLAEQKDAPGGELAVRMSRPRSTKGGKAIWWDVPERLELLYGYCKQDVRTERAVYHATRRLSPLEREVYLLDQRMNDRGVLVDLPTVRAALRIVDTGLERVNADVARLTEGKVPNVVNKPADLRAWLGVESVRKSVIREMLEGEQPSVVRQVLEARAEAGRSSVAKLRKMVETASSDGRVRGTLLYHGAGTGRWAGRGIQPQNFVRPILPVPAEYRDVVEYLNSLTPLVRVGDYDLLDAVEPPLPLLSFMLRTMLVAAPGHRLMVGDFAQIEARVLAWIAGERWLVEAFERGEPIYERMAARIYDVPASEITKKDPRRQMGKDTELGCGYQMGGKLGPNGEESTFARQIWEKTGVRVPAELAEKAVTEYRTTHQNVVQLWYDLSDAVEHAVRMPGAVTSAGVGATVKFVVRGVYLYMVLPSGRPLVYAKPRIRPRETPWGEVRPAVVVEGTDQITRRWHAYALYGGLLTENVVQAVSRDLLALAMLRLERAGYPNVLTVHDEAVCEVPEGHGNMEEFRALMWKAPKWAAGCPIDVEAWEGPRYGKR